ncbi:hypothetical protein EG328_007599 [Venturia inaequalis]|uniref:Uncharacterized protein n=1 Tax=Venturia inaequalis TaxID=5025 RepID=A0A8H3ZAI6_VENIN|nr:hypothetical protein EG328_007599 [Venturia inaequalis]RDI86480.1 hypothetical protein Vi05172_g3517 [Venturia inaequalis]
MRFFIASYALMVIAAVNAAPVASPQTGLGTAVAGLGVGEITGPVVNTAVGGQDNVQTTDATADTLGVAQTGGDQAEDSNAIPQEALDSLIGRKAKRQGVVTDAVPAPVAAPLEGANELADGLLGDSDQIANNVLGVCGENTTPSSVNCDGFNTK